MPVRKHVQGEPGTADNFNKSTDDMLEGSGFNKDGTDFNGFAKKTDLSSANNANALDHRATSVDIATRLGFTKKKDQRQAVKLPGTITNLAGLIRVGNRLFGVDGPLPANAIGHVVRFNNLEDLSDFLIAPIPTAPAAGATTGAWAITYVSSKQRLYTLTQNNRLLEIHPDTLAFVDIAQLQPINGNLVDVSHSITSDDRYLYLISYSSGGGSSGTPGLVSRMIRYDTTNFNTAPLILDIANTARAEAAVLARGKLYVLGQWSHSYGAAYAHSWVARIDATTMVLEQLVRLPNEWDAADQICAAGDFIFVGCGNPKGPQFYRLSAEDLTHQVLIHSGIPETFIGCAFDGSYVWAYYTGITVGSARFLRVDPENMECVRFKIPDAATTETSVPPQAVTQSLLSDGERLFVQMGNVTALTGANDPGTNSTLGPYLQRVVVLEPIGKHHAMGGIPALSVGLDSYGHGRVLSVEVAGMHNLGGGQRMQKLGKPTNLGIDPVAPELGGQPANTNWTYYVVPKDAFGRRGPMSDPVTIVGAAVLGGMAFHRFGWQHLDGAATYEVLDVNLHKLAEVQVPAFLDDGSHVPDVTYSPAFYNETADSWFDGVLSLSSTSPTILDGLHAIYINDPTSGITPRITIKNSSSFGWCNLWQENDVGNLSVHYMWGSNSSSVTAGTISRKNVAEWIALGGDIVINTVNTGKKIYICTQNVIRGIWQDTGGVEVVGANMPLFLHSPNGTRYKLTVSDAGALVIAAG